jgi:hypothetical protein
MWIGMVVWLLASGHFQGEQWQRFTSREACEEAHTAPFHGDKLLFFTACIDEESAKKMQSLRFGDFTVNPGSWAKP